MNLLPWPLTLKATCSAFTRKNEWRQPDAINTDNEIVEHQRIVSTMSFFGENGRAVPGSEVSVPGVLPDAITVTVEFKEADGKTTVAVTENGIPLIMKLPATIGWQQQFDKFEKLLLENTQ